MSINHIATETELTSNTENKKWVYIAWSLLLSGWILMPIAPIAAIVVCYIQNEKISSIENSHYKKVIRTFWLSFLGWVVCIVLYLTLVGIVIAIPLGIAISVFVTYRGIKGLIRISENQPYA